MFALVDERMAYRRLQDRLKLFHKQNKENVRAAKAQIEAIRRQQCDVQKQETSVGNPERAAIVRLKSVLVSKSIDPSSLA